MLLAQLLLCFQEIGSFSCHHNPHRFLQPEVLRLYFAHTETLGCTVCLAPHFFLLVFVHANVELLILPATALSARSASCGHAADPLHSAARLCPSYQVG